VTLLAHAGHWLMSVGFAGPPLLLVAGLVTLTVRERRAAGGGSAD
jgi:hypothetical protein